ncbi:major capsid protein [Pseudomonas sp.]|uniref:major capsid protein n=1 Tax=Pseudomonas sp. TaxID=306 RepID=UPI00257BD436|nr:major capsid protein [Pseudomonas sp.]
MKQLKTQLQNTASNFGRRSRQLATGAIASASVMAGSVYAAVPPEATGALDEAGTDVGTIGWAVFAVIIAAMAFKYMRRAL